VSTSTHPEGESAGGRPISVERVSSSRPCCQDWPTGEAGAGGHLLLLKRPPGGSNRDALGAGNVYDEVKSYGGNMVWRCSFTPG